MHSPSTTGAGIHEYVRADEQPVLADQTVLLARQRLWTALAVGAAAFLLYLFCMSSTVTYSGDCGELIAASYRLGIAHPSGYPLYCLLGRLFASLVPFGEVGWRYNLLSAVLGSVMVGFMTATVHRLTVTPTASPTTSQAEHSPALLYDQWPAIGAGLLLAGFYFVGSQGFIAEVSMLEGMTECVLLYCAVAWHQEADWRWAYTGALVMGFAILAHLTSMFAVPGLLIYAVYQHHRRFAAESHADGANSDVATTQDPVSSSAKSLIMRRGVLFVALPLLVYALTLYLPLRSRLYPEPSPPRAWAPLDWTHPVDFRRWRTHVSGQQYRIHLLKPTKVSLAGHQFQVPWFVKPLSTVPADLGSLLYFIASSYLWFTPLILVGAWLSLKRGDTATQQRTGGRWLGVSLLIICLFNIGVEINYDVGDQSNFFFPSYMAMSIWMGLGIAAMLRTFLTWGERLNQRTGNPMWQWRLATLGWMLVLGTVAVEWNIFTGASSFRGVTSARDAALERAEAAERIAQPGKPDPILLLMEDDSLWGFWYVHYVLDRAPHVRTPWGPLRNQIAENQHLVDFVTDLQKSGPVAINEFDWTVDQRFPYTPLTPSGNLWLASRRALPLPATPASSNSDDATAPGDIFSARFRRTPLTQVKGVHDAGEALLGLSRQEIKSLPKSGLAILKRDDMAILDLDFKVSSAMVKRLAHAPQDRVNKTALVGWVEVLLARKGYLKGTPTPGPHEMSIKSSMTPPLMVYTQQRRLVAPLSIREGMRLHAVIPMQVEGDTVSDLYQVWTRLITDPHDKTTPWQRTDTARLVIT